MNAFTISLQVHHLSRDLRFLTDSLHTQPTVCMRAGELAGETVRKTSVWHAPLYRGDNQQHFDQALAGMIRFVHDNEAVLEEFAGDDAMLEMIFTFRVGASEAKPGGLAHTVNLQPAVLYELARRQIGVKVQTMYA